MKKLFALMFVVISSQSFCMDRGITADMNGTQESSSSYHISSESLAYMARKCDLLTEVMHTRGEYIRLFEDSKAEIGILLDRYEDLSGDIQCKIYNLTRFYCTSLKHCDMTFIELIRKVNSDADSANESFISGSKAVIRGLLAEVRELGAQIKELVAEIQAYDLKNK